MAAPSEEAFYLKWAKHSEEIVGVLSALRAKDAFCDVTVVCSATDAGPAAGTDDRDYGASSGAPVMFRAHKVILAACSTFFEQIFSCWLSRPEQSGVLVLTDVRQDLLKMLLDFVYDGEISVCEEDLNEFMETAEKLGIRGLQENSSDEDNQSSSSRGDASKRTVPPTEQEKASSKRRKQETSTLSLRVDSVSSLVKSATCQGMMNSEANEADEHVEYVIVDPPGERPCVEEIWLEDQVNETDESDPGSAGYGPIVDDGSALLGSPMMIPPELDPNAVELSCQTPSVYCAVNGSGKKVHFCGRCEYSSVNLSHVKRHVLGKHTEERPFVCAICNAGFKRRERLVQHHRTHAKEPQLQ